MLCSAMTLAGPLADPGPADMQYEYIIWDILCGRALLWAIAEHMGVTIVPSTPAEPADPRSQIVWQVLEATVGRIDTANSTLGENDRCSAESLAEWGRGGGTERGTSGVRGFSSSWCQRLADHSQK